MPPTHQKRLYAKPDYALVFDSDSRKAVVQELESLKKLKGCYFEFLDRLDRVPKKQDKEVSREDERMVVVFYFEDSIINAKAE